MKDIWDNAVEQTSVSVFIEEVVYYSDEQLEDLKTSNSVGEAMMLIFIGTFIAGLFLDKIKKFLWSNFLFLQTIYFQQLFNV